MEEDWERLAIASGNIFSTREWAETWQRHLAGGSLTLHAFRRADGTTVALLPLAGSSIGPLRVLRFAGYGPADQLGPVCAPDDVPEVARRLWDFVRARGSDVPPLLLERLAGSQNWPQLLDLPVIRSESSPVLVTAGRTWDEFLASKSRNFREQVRRRERKLGRDHDLSFRLADASTLARDFGTLVRLHGLRWGTASAFAGPREKFHRAFAARALDRGWLRLWLLDLDGDPVAAWYGFRFAGVDSYYNGGRDPKRDDYSPGFVLLAHTIRHAFDDGIAEYRFLLGDEAYKGRFADADLGLRTLLVARRPLPHLAAIGAAAAARAPASIRRRLMGTS